MMSIDEASVTDFSPTKENKKNNVKKNNTLNTLGDFLQQQQEESEESSCNYLEFPPTWSVSQNQIAANPKANNTLNTLPTTSKNEIQYP